MKACPVCGLDLEESYLFCPEDGSSLESSGASLLSNESPENRMKGDSIEESKPSSAGTVVLYCPACAAEYPLTFSECPVHGVALTKHGIPAFVKPRANAAQQTPEPPLRDGEAFVHQQSQSAASSSNLIAKNSVEPMPQGDESLQEAHLIGDRVDSQGLGHESSPITVEGADAEPRSFKIAALLLVVGLAVLSLIGFYALYLNATRRPVSQAARSGNRQPVAAQESSFIPTPEAARDYKEEPPVSSKPVAPAADGESRGDKEPAHTVAAAPGVNSRKTEERKPLETSYQRPARVPTQTPVAVKRPASATDLVLPRGTYGLVDARLIRMKARQTPSGYRYDLTFNLQEEAGRITQYDRLAIVTRSASGVNHSEVMPFYHRLGAAGTLTFTISVELKGRSEADWQGRIICTSMGTDVDGRPLRTSFGANVSP